MPKKPLAIATLVGFLLTSVTIPAFATPNSLFARSFFKRPAFQKLSPTSIIKPTPRQKDDQPLAETPIPQASPTPTPKPTPKPSVRPPSMASITNDTVQTFIMNAINDYRHSQGLGDVKTDRYTCDFANERAQELTDNFNHDGFTNRVNAKTLPYPSYTKITENIAMTSNYQQVVPMWIASSGHAENMRADTPNVCVERNGNYYAYEGWKQ